LDEKSVRGRQAAIVMGAEALFRPHQRSGKSHYFCTAGAHPRCAGPLHSEHGHRLRGLFLVTPRARWPLRARDSPSSHDRIYPWVPRAGSACLGGFRKALIRGRSAFSDRTQIQAARKQSKSWARFSAKSRRAKRIGDRARRMPYQQRGLQGQYEFARERARLGLIIALANAKQALFQLLIKRL